uniref:Solute carrier family 40 protein n=1 Tax=Macrostomum lignano TaxID=282301 RepID=A0A1I8F905_9PLAT
PKPRPPVPFGLPVADIAGRPLFTPRRPTKAAAMSPHLANESPAAAFRPVWLNYGGLAFCTPRCVILAGPSCYFLVWNSVNDYVFGWLRDGGTLAGRTAGRIVERAAAPAGQIWAAIGLELRSDVAALAAGWPAVQFPCLPLRSGTGSAWAPALASGAASGSVFVSYLVWDRARLLPFRLFTTLLGLRSAGWLPAVSVGAFAELTRPAPRPLTKSSEVQEMPSKPLCSQLRSFSGQLFSHKNFVYFCCTQLLQVFHCHFNSNFFPLFLLLLSSEQSSTEYSASTVSLIVRLCWPSSLFCRISTTWPSFGCATPTEPTQLGLLLAKALSGLFVLTALPTGTLPLACLLLSNRVFTEGVCKLLNLPNHLSTTQPPVTHPNRLFTKSQVSDLVDEDYAMHRRSEPISALIFGRPQPCLSKPGQTLAPLLGTALFSHFVGRDLLWCADRPLAAGAAPLDSAARLGCLRVLGWVPLACGCACNWRCLHGDRQRRVKELCWLPTAGAGAAALRFLNWCHVFSSEATKSKPSGDGPKRRGKARRAKRRLMSSSSSNKEQQQEQQQEQQKQKTSEEESATAQPRPLIEYLSWLYEFYGQMGKFKMTEKQLTGYREKAGAKLAEFQGLIDSLCRCAVYLFQQHRDDAFVSQSAEDETKFEHERIYATLILGNFHNYTDCSVSFCVTLSKSEFFFTEMVIPALVGWYDKQDQELAKATVNSLLGLTYNMFFKNNSEIYDVLSRVGVVDSVKPYLKSSDVELASSRANTDCVRFGRES